MARSNQKGFTTMSSLLAAADAVVKQAAKDKNGLVAKAVVDEGKRQVQETVYDAYTNGIYDRSGQLKEQWVVESVEDGILVYNDRRDGDRYVAEIVETGDGYDQRFPFVGVPRPFTQNTIDELARSGKHVQALQDELIRRGHRVIRG
ncbi:hypothetical protein ACI2JA_04130 [Alkalihalobacillus sp. NPDC078783]